jgi:hypothetical protein
MTQFDTNRITNIAFWPTDRLATALALHNESSNNPLALSMYISIRYNKTHLDAMQLVINHPQQGTFETTIGQAAESVASAARSAGEWILEDPDFSDALVVDL